MASLCTAAPLPRTVFAICSSLQPLRIPTKELSSSSTFLGFSRVNKRQLSANTAVCLSSKPKNGGEGEGEEDSEDSLPDALLSSVRNDSDYLLKVAAGSVGGASAIKYGSILFPDITRPNIIQGLLMVSLPVVVAVLIILKESFLGSQDEDQV